jgi:hypothetical protein
VNSNVTVTLDSAAPAGGINVGLSSNNAAVVVPATVNVPVGQTTALVPVTTIGVATNQTVTLTATLNATRTGTLTVTAAQLTGLSLAQTTIAGGTTTTGTVTLDGVAPAAGRVVSLSSFDTNVATVPANVTVTNGQTTATFTATAQPVTDSGQSDLTATLGAQTQTQTLFVTRAVGGISGTVVDQATGYPLVGAGVILVTNTANVAYTALTGAFTLTDISAGSHSVSVEMYGYATQTSGTLTVTNGQTAAAGTLSLVADTLTAYGNAFNPDASENLEGVTVTAVYGGQTATTDANGNYTMPGVTPGLEIFVFHKAGYVSESSGQWLISPADNVNVNIHMRPVDLNQIHQTGVASGVVRDTAGNPLAGVTVSVAGKPAITTTTAANGTYSLALPLGAAYVLTAQKAGFRFTASTPQPGRPGHFDTNWRVLQDFTLPTSAAVGTVNVTTVEPVSRTNGAGVVDLFVPGGRYRVWTNATGTRSISNVPAGPMWDCRLRRDVPAASSVASNCSGNAVVPMVTPRWSAAGQVLSRATSLPISGASVFQGPGVDETVTTDSNGRFSLSGRAEGAYAVTASAAAIRAARASGSPFRGQRRERQLYRSPSGSTDERVGKPRHRPAPQQCDAHAGSGEPARHRDVCGPRRLRREHHRVALERSDHGTGLDLHARRPYLHEHRHVLEPERPADAHGRGRDPLRGATHRDPPDHDGDSGVPARDRHRRARRDGRRHHDQRGREAQRPGDRRRHHRRALFRQSLPGDGPGHARLPGRGEREGRDPLDEPHGDAADRADQRDAARRHQERDAHDPAVHDGHAQRHDPGRGERHRHGRHQCRAHEQPRHLGRGLARRHLHARQRAARHAERHGDPYELPDGHEHRSHGGRGADASVPALSLRRTP